MFFFKKKKISILEPIVKGFVERHCHILPGVDDGVQHMDESLAMLTLLENYGVSEVWLTPHIMEDIPNTPQDLQERLNELLAVYKGSLKIHLSAENMLDNLFEDRLASGNLLPWGKGGNHLLVETSYFNPPIGLYEMLEKIQKKGYFPVLAHPERYVYMQPHDYEHLKEMGVLFQLNLPSLEGGYGEAARHKALEFLKRGDYYNFVGSDMHSLRHCHRFLDLELDSKVLDQVLDVIHSSQDRV